MKLRKPWMIALGSLLAYWIVRLWTGTIRVRSNTKGQRTDPWDPAVDETYIYAFWHESLITATAVRSCLPAAALISLSADGQLLSGICRRFKVHAIRGSSSRGGEDALEEMIGLAGKSHILLAPDGPKGPPHEVKRGLIYLAGRSGMRIVPLGIAFSRSKRVGSWDRMHVPLPFSRIACVAGPVMQVPPGLGKAAMERYRQELQSSLESANLEAEAWLRGVKPPPLPGLCAAA